MAPDICGCHVHGFSHWKFENLRNKYDLGRKVYFEGLGVSEPRLILYVSVRRMIGDEWHYDGKLSIILSRNRWAEIKGVILPIATNELETANNDLDSDPARVLIGVAEREIRSRMDAYENSGDLDLGTIYV